MRYSITLLRPTTAQVFASTDNGSNEPTSGLYIGADFYLHTPQDAFSNVTPSINVSYTPPVAAILLNCSGPGIFQFRVLTNETSLQGFPKDGLFLPAGNGSTEGINSASQNANQGNAMSAEEVCFICPTEQPSTDKSTRFRF